MRSTILVRPYGDDVTRFDRPPLEPGMIGVELSGQGRLLRSERVTPAFAPDGDRAGPAATAETTDWAGVLALARLDKLELRETEPRRHPRGAWNDRRARITTPKVGGGRRCAWRPLRSTGA